MSHSTLILAALLLLLPPVLFILASRSGFLFPAVLLIAGFVASELLVMTGVDTGLRFDNFQFLVFHILLPALIFQAALEIDLHHLRKNLALILFLAIPLMLLSSVVIAVLVYYGIGHDNAFPWIAALLLGALLSATDPVAVVDLLKTSGVVPETGIVLDGESLFNDAAAIVLFTLVLNVALNPASTPGYSAALLQFIYVFVGGLAVGLVSGAIFSVLLRSCDDLLVVPVTIGAAYLSYVLAEELLLVSGVSSVLACGLCIEHYARSRRNEKSMRFILRFWETVAFMASSAVFLLMGMTITVAMFEERWLAMVIGISAVLLARAIGIFGALSAFRHLCAQPMTKHRDKRILFWGGLRGAVTLALALSLPTSLDYWWTIQSIAFGVVVFSLFVQAPTMPLLLRHGPNQRSKSPN